MTKKISVFRENDAKYFKDYLTDVIREVMRDIDEGGAAAERQEHAFVSAINDYADQSAPIKVNFQGNNIVIDDVIGASKVEGLAAHGQEPYTDVQVHTSSKKYNFSMKGVSAPSLAGGGAAGIEKIAPGWLATITPKVVERLLEMGFEDGDWFVNKSKDIAGIVGKLARTYSKKAPGVAVKIAGYPDGKEYSIYEEDEGYIGLPPYIGNATVEKGEGEIKIINHIKDNEAAKHLPDMFFKVDEESIRALLAGTEEMGGPVDYTYKGPMDVVHEWDEGTRTLSLTGASAYDIDNFVASYPDIYLRIRKRRADQPFAPNMTHKRLGSAIFGTGVFSRESYARIVVTDKLSKKAEYGGEL